MFLSAGLCLSVCLSVCLSLCPSVSVIVLVLVSLRIASVVVGRKKATVILFSSLGSDIIMIIGLIIFCEIVIRKYILHADIMMLNTC